RILRLSRTLATRSCARSRFPTSGKARNAHVRVRVKWLMHRGWACFLVIPLVLGCCGCQIDALATSANIQARHFPFGTILDPIFASPDNTDIVGYTRCGDSAIWTGHYLAAESFRYRVTGDPNALANAQKALAGLQTLVDV